MPTLLIRAAALALAAGAGGCAASIRDPPILAQPPPRSCHALGAGEFSLPEARCTPGAVDRRVTQRNLARTICRTGYADSVRPPESISEPGKLASMRAYGDHDSPRHYEYDHLISLELGGAPSDPHNLWPEPGASPNAKDRLEDRLHDEVCDRRISLATARYQIATDWVAAYHRLLGATR